MILYRNEAELLEDRIKKEFNNKYKNLILKSQLDINNELVYNMIFTLIDPLLKTERRFIISVEDKEGLGILIQIMWNEIETHLSEIVKNHYIR